MTRPSQYRKHETTIRPCMCCKRPFESEWIGNRLCPTCGGVEVDTAPPLIERVRVSGQRGAQ